ncbi:type IV pilin protein [Nitratidesulfovibrio sp. SRB-5]|uniref:type IV pilin protein n=1 Tax=Nitratidesulfovibrio sp. SRB-5 TaxID=2872636 RepID=UPI001025FA11|nr:prepilin-type N-terminal cleavage/methylation domain-containing protein [Nitratidesulfovibrio sp. SRB-5]MBZ2173508.1 prepilin-type N-terminal cleavage/methylation domain-containing protein [Nitratidesulfovibrio sp. SRB-5]RXF76648.1 prepilin-type N-terminal cleavage/methylation domain-containing protein [Desulfovibrio sp. DS-1]
MTQNKKDRQKEAGFTLIEIIAVLVILGILAAVAVPKYFELTANAANRATDAAAAEVQARVNQLFADSLLNANGACTAALTAMGTNNAQIFDSGTLIGGWTVTGVPTTFTSAATATITLINDAANVPSPGQTRTLRVPSCQ